MTTKGQPTPQAYFGSMIETVLGQALITSGYELENTPMHHARGLFRYAKALGDGVNAYAEFQLLYYQGAPSRFRVNLLRNTGKDARSRNGYTDQLEITLSRLVWEMFGIQQLDAAEHWWTFGNPQQLGAALVEAGKLLIGFGLPYLEGTLKPEDL